jgi:hypothetical protein
MFDFDVWLFPESRSYLGAKRFIVPYNMGLTEATLMLERFSRSVPMNDLLLHQPQFDNWLG